MLRPIYTEPENCQDCYKCIRECPVKAIMVEGNKHLLRPLYSDLPNRRKKGA